ncbi:MAG: phosphoglycerate kinase [Bdellovibrionaceae bacterium]|nr:phosphoglycerate kinase [Pseudobdellovibrionaceae bacterium]
MRFLRDLENLKDKKVFLRLDLNVPMKDGKILDDTRIREALPTINYLLEQGCRLLIGSHLGRPKGNSEEDKKKYSLEPVAQDLVEKLKKEVVLIDSPDSDAPRGLLAEGRMDKILLLENLRFCKGEEANDNSLAQKWAKCVDVYVNDAYGSCHRAHASIDALPRAMRVKAAGFLIEKEVEVLSKIRNAPETPFALILGGSKVSDKIGVIENMINKIDILAVGGAMAYTFLKAQGVPVGASRVESDKVAYAKELLKRFSAREKTVLLPIDHVIVKSLDTPKGFQTTKEEAIPEGWMGVDIGPQSRELFAKELARAKTIFWNGPMGVYEIPPFNEGSFALAKTIAESTAFSVIGGGDSAAAAVESGYSEKMDHISTGGGASLEYMEGKTLPGLDALEH